MRFAAHLLGMALVLLALPAFAQARQGTPARIRGTVEKLDGNRLAVKERNGQSVTIELASNYTVRGVVKRSLSDIHDGDFVASTSTRGPDGKLHAIEVHIFPEQMKSVVPQFQGPWDLVPDSVMTNAIVTGMAEAPDGRILKVKYKDTETEVVVPANCPIVSYVPGDSGLLKSGAYVVILGTKSPEGEITAANITAEKDGVKPPM
jgi:hypothetical protein